MQKWLVDINVEKKSSAKYMLKFYSDWINIRQNKSDIIIISLLFITKYKYNQNLKNHSIYICCLSKLLEGECFFVEVH